MSSTLRTPYWGHLPWSTSAAASIRCRATWCPHGTRTCLRCIPIITLLLCHLNWGLPLPFDVPSMLPSCPHPLHALQGLLWHICRHRQVNTIANELLIPFCNKGFCLRGSGRAPCNACVKEICKCNLQCHGVQGASALNMNPPKPEQLAEGVPRQVTPSSLSLLSLRGCISALPSGFIQSAVVLVSTSWFRVFFRAQRESRMGGRVHDAVWVCAVGPEMWSDGGGEGGVHGILCHEDDGSCQGRRGDCLCPREAVVAVRKGRLRGHLSRGAPTTTVKYHM